jgi:hypothetical protein
MHLALIEIRAQNVDKDRMTYYLADLFHNIPLQIESIIEGRKTENDVWEWLQERARQNGEASVQWLQSALEGAKLELKTMEDNNAGKRSQDDNETHQ